jgi:predicted nucleic acid-binding protein
VIVADASVLIAHLDDTDEHHDAALELLLDTQDDPLGASTITVAEVLVGPTRSGRMEQARGALHALGLVEIPLAADAATHLATLRAETGLKLPDCCVLLAAQGASASGIVSFDARLIEVASRLGLSTGQTPQPTEAAEGAATSDPDD